MSDPRRQIGTFAVVALVLLRLAIGWHFYREGSAKVAFDKSAQRFDVTFSAEGFLSQAKGPLAGFYRSFISEGHDWPALLAVAKQDQPPTEAEASEAAKWQLEYAERRAAAERNSQPAPVEFPPSAPYSKWANRIAADWKVTLNKSTAVSGVTEEQKSAMNSVLTARKQQLADYLATQSEAIVDYQHELWRLENAQARPEADGLPFVEQQVAGAAAQTAREPLRWVKQVGDFEREYVEDLRDILASEQQADSVNANAVSEALATSQQKRLDTINLVVAVLTIGVGVCLLVGLFTRLAATAGALFLLSVIASQPPWVAGAAATYYQTVELAGLLVLAGTGAGRWAGLDYFGYAICGRFCRRGNAAKK